MITNPRARAARASTFRARFAPALTLVLVALAAIACGGSTTPTHPTVGSFGPRPSTSATVEIVEPATATTVSGPTTKVVLRLNGATIVPETTTDIRPDEGHVHLYVNNQLVSMNYGLEQDIPVSTGTLVLKAEFVAADHAPFNPRVWSSETIFTVR
jgi:hypothetical protein